MVLDESQIRELVEEYGDVVNEGRTIAQIVTDGDIPRLKSAIIQQGKVSDSIHGPSLVTKDGLPIRLMYRTNRISTHDQNRGAIPFKDQVLAVNHDYMLSLVSPILGTSQFSVPGLNATSTVIPAENLDLIQLENVFRMYMAKSSTSTSLYQHWLAVKDDPNVTVLQYAGHEIKKADLFPNCKLPYLMDTPSTKEKVDRTIDTSFLYEAGICTPDEYLKIKHASVEAFMKVSDSVREKGMVLVDTKTEHGINTKGKIVSADELYTMDSSRYWKLDEDGNIMMNGDSPVSYSKEFARGMVKGPNDTFTPEQATEIAVRYIQGIQHLTGRTFEPDLRPRDERLIWNTNLALDYLM